MKKKQVTALIAVAAVLGCLGGGYYFREEIAGVFTGSKAAEDKVYVEKLSRVMNQYSGVENRYNGVVESQDSYEVNVDSSRTISEILVQVGDAVEQGQTLVKYDVGELEMQVKQANLDLEGIYNEIENERKDIETLNKKHAETMDEDEKFRLETEIRTAENNITQKELDVESKKLEIEKYQKQIAESSVISKKSGIVREINETGMNSSGDESAFMVIQQEGEYRIKGTISEQNIWMLTEGQPVIIRSRVEDKTWEGTLQKLDTENNEKDNQDTYYYGGSSDSQSSTKYPFYVQLDTSDGLMLGQHVYIEMDEGQQEVKEGIWIFADYVVQDESGAYVWAANEKDRLEKRYVELGEYDGELNEYEILSGLSGDDYIAWPMEGLYEGVTAVTDSEEVDYTAPLYNQESTEDMDLTDGNHGSGDMQLVPEGAELFPDVDGTEFFGEMDGAEYIDGGESLGTEAVE